MKQVVSWHKQSLENHRNSVLRMQKEAEGGREPQVPYRL